MVQPPHRRRAIAARPVPARRRAAALVVAALATAGCSGASGGDGASRASRLERALGLVTAEALRTHVETLAADDMEGRRPGSAGHDRARDYIAQALAARGIERGGAGGTSYLHTYPTAPQPEYLYPYPNGFNVVGVHRGTVAPSEMVVVSAHYDHLGYTRAGLVMNGAYDDATGVGALIELASAFRRAGYQARRSVVSCSVTTRTPATAPRSGSARRRSETRTTSCSASPSIPSAAPTSRATRGPRSSASSTAPISRHSSGRCSRA
ncbi:MAG: M28 family peptidase [Deltaproteobacteria bacterium]|nr:M28 family peptidase [Deltaproteobacteria bacterium]